MPKFAPNLTLFTEVPFLEPFAAAKNAGFSTVEYLYPYEFKPGDLKCRLQKNDLKQVLFNLPSGDRSKGDRIAVIQIGLMSFALELLRQ